MTEESKPWHRKPNESPLAYDWFQKYLFMGPSRTMKKVIQEHDQRTSYINQLRAWSKKHPWKKRAEAYDNYIAQKLLEQHEKSMLQGS